MIPSGSAAQLREALGLTIDADVLAQDVLNGFNGVSGGHGLGDFLVECGLQFVNGLFEMGFAAELFDQLDRHAHGIEGGNFQYFDIIQAGDYAFILIFIQHGTGLLAVFSNHIVLFNIVGAFTAGQRWLIEGDVADQIEGV